MLPTLNSITLQAFPLKSSVIRKNSKNKWITKGLIVSRRGMYFLKWLKRTIPLTSETLNHMHNYQSILRKVLKEAKKIDIDKCVLLSKNKTKTVWQCVSKQIGNSRNHNRNLVIRDNDELITNP
jgi:hypothetical protein